MDFDVILSGLMAVFGSYSLLARKFAPNYFWKHEPMKIHRGEKVDFAIHVLAYTVLPLGVGAMLLIGALV